MLKEEKRLQDFADAGEEKVAAMLGSLARVEAPGHFNAHVRARIAKGRPAEVRSAWFPVFARLAAPALVLTAVGGYFGYNALYQPVEVSPVAIAETPIGAPAVEQPTVENVVEPVPASTAEVAGVKSPGNANSNASVAQRNKGGSFELPMKEPRGGSLDTAVSATNTINVPAGNDNVETTGNSSLRIPTATLSVREVFSAMGIRASHSGAGWRVSSASGRAAAAGLKTGDMIESVNGQAVGANTVFDANFVGRSLRVKRDGASIQISL